MITRQVEDVLCIYFKSQVGNVDNNNEQRIVVNELYAVFYTWLEKQEQNYWLTQFE